MEIAISGTSGFLGQHLLVRFKEPYRLGREGKLPKKFDTVYSLAAYGNMAGHVADPYQVYKANTLRIARELKQLKGTETKYIYISTSSVELPYQTFYSASKKATEEMIQIAVRDWKIKALIVRPFSVTGRGEQFDHLIPKLILSCETGQEMPFVSSPVHDFVDVEDLIDALILLKDKGLFVGETYDVGSGKQTSNKEVKDIVEAVTKQKANLKYVDQMRNYDSRMWRANPSMLYRMGWKAKKPLIKSIREELEYIRIGLMA